MDNASLQNESFEARATAEVVAQQHRLIVDECLHPQTAWPALSLIDRQEDHHSLPRMTAFLKAQLDALWSARPEATV